MQSMRPTGLPPESWRSRAMNRSIYAGMENAPWLMGETKFLPIGASRAAAMSDATLGRGGPPLGLVPPN